MPARLRNFIIDPGADFVRVIDVTDSAGELLDMSSGYTATLTLYNDDGSQLAQYDTENGITLGDGTISIEVDAAVLDDLSLAGLARRGTLTEPAPPLASAQDPQPDYIAVGSLANYDLHLSNESGDDYRLLKGQFCFANR